MKTMKVRDTLDYDLENLRMINIHSKELIDLVNFQVKLENKVEGHERTCLNGTKLRELSKHIQEVSRDELETFYDRFRK